MKKRITYFAFAASILLLNNCLLSCSQEKTPFTVNFIGGGGYLYSGNESQTVNDSKEIEEPVYKRVGYDFDGWNIPLLSLKKSATVKALWREQTYSITYHLNGGTNSPSNPNYYNVSFDKIILEDAHKDGYDFACWTNVNGDEISIINTSSATDFEIYANYKAINNIYS